MVRSLHIIKRYIIKIIIIFVLLLQGVPAFAKLEYSVEEKKVDLENSKICKEKGEGYFKIEDDIGCFTGPILDNEAYEQLLSDLSEKKIEKLHFSSPGGDVILSMNVAREIRASKVRIVIHTYCFSSCANYILPSAHILAVQKYAVIGMHGSLPRSVPFYLKTVKPPVRVGPNNEVNMDGIINTINEYPKFYRDLVRKENDFFLDMVVSEQYLTRYFELQRNSKNYNSGECGDIAPIALIIGPQYFDEFYSGNLLEFDWNPETLAETDIFKFLANKYSIVMDNELLPSRTPSMGIIDKSICFTGI